MFLAMRRLICKSNKILEHPNSFFAFEVPKVVMLSLSSQLAYLRFKPFSAVSWNCCQSLFLMRKKTREAKTLRVDMIYLKITKLKVWANQQ